MLGDGLRAQRAQQLPMGTPQCLDGSLGFGKRRGIRWDEHSRNIPAVYPVTLGDLFIGP